MASTAPIHLPSTAPIALPPYRRNTAARHRRTVAAWAADRTVRFVRAWLAQPVRLSRGRHAAVLGSSATVAVLTGVIAQLVVR